MAKNIAVIGDSESIKGFAAIGMDIYPCDDNENAPHLFRKIADGDNYAVIFITEEMFGLVEKERKRYEERLIPAVIPIPGVKGNTGIGIKRLSSLHIIAGHLNCFMMNLRKLIIFFGQRPFPDVTRKCRSLRVRKG